MDEKLTATLEKIQEAALTEFLDKGFLGRSEEHTSELQSRE